MSAHDVLLAFFLKGAIVPFHAWAPDAYEGATLPVTAYMATVIALRRSGRAMVIASTPSLRSTFTWASIETSFRKRIG